MATRIRLQRHGKKNQPFYHIVIADGRAPRDGRFIELLGTYNPLTNPASVSINFERALYWVETGAAPTDTVRSILKREGVYLMKHLKGGVAKGAITENDMVRKFDAWKKEKEAKLNNLKRELAEKERGENKKRLEAETKVKEAIAAKVAEKLAAKAAEEAKAAADAAEETAAEVENTEEAPAENTEA
ncbi:MAG: 30S ribosomal protein S16 [Bacteroidales bacterium]|nr:30S ribosomal protein S16 [Bacteroidales bacterium]